jgi:phosphatidylglycerophosphate synthase
MNFRPASESVINLPNAVSAVRLVGAFVLVGLAWLSYETVFVVLLVLLVLTDWVDGRLAVLLDLRTEFGAYLDSIADIALYTAMLAGAAMMRGDVIAAEAGWIAAASASYLVPVIAGIVKFRTMPSFHTYLAKLSWLLVAIAATCVFTGLAAWPIRIAATAVIITNLEIFAMVIVMRRRAVDKPSLYSVLKQQ